MRRGRRRTRWEREQRIRRIRRGCCAAGAILLMISLAMTPGLRAGIARAARRGWQSAQVFAGTSPGEAECTLPAMEIYALQLGAYEKAESAAGEQARLMARGIPCVLWQQKPARIVCGAAFSKSALNETMAEGMECCAVSEQLPQVDIRFGGEIDDARQAAELFMLPDQLLGELIAGERPLEDIITEAKTQAEDAQGRHPENEMYTQLAESLISWGELMDEAPFSGEKARNYAASTMTLLCRELRLALLGGDQAI